MREFDGDEDEPASGAGDGASARRHADLHDGPDGLTYTSLPIPYTQPAHMAAMARLFGLTTPDPAQARVLEIGCSTGANIIPLALRYPGLSILGLDLSADHVALARARIAALGLSNVEIRQADVSAVDLGPAAFDFIICHGVFSWVPAAARSAILDLCGRYLAPEGVAAISYNVLPGWHARSIIRDIALREAGEGPPMRRVGRVRAAIARIAEGLSERTVYRRIVASEAKRLVQRPASYILGEFLAPFNAPLHVGEVMLRARANGLAYLCEGDVPTSAPGVLDGKQGSAIRKALSADRDVSSQPNWSADDADIRLEQTIDDFSGRPFRRSLFTRAGRVSTRPSLAGNDVLRGLCLSASLRPKPGAPGTYLDNRGRTLTGTNPWIRSALSQLAEAYPATVSPLELLTGPVSAGGANARGERPSDVDARILDTMMRLVRAGTATATALPLRTGTAATASAPAVWPLARLEAAAGQPWVTGLDHSAVPLQPGFGPLIAQLDGSMTREGLTRAVAAALHEGTLRLGDQPAGSLSAAAARQQAPATADQLVRFLARHALLEPGPLS